MTSPSAFKRAASSLLALVVFALFLTVPTDSAAADVQATYYVSPSGSDTNPGTLAAPFRTVQHARDVVRTVNSAMTGDIQVYLRGGKYAVTSTIGFGPSDSGTNGHRISYSAYPGESPVLDGGVQVTGWTQQSGNVWKAPLSRATKLRSLYVNDKRALMASKTINSAGCYGTYAVTAGQADWAWESGSQCDGVKYGLSDLPAIARNQADLEIETATTWTTTIVGVRQVTTSSDGANRVALLQQPGAAIAQGALNGNFQINGSHKLMNAYEFLDTPGEFFFDRTNQTLYYYKADAENMATAAVWAPNNVSTLLKIAGTSTSDHVHDLTFSGITVQHSDWNLFDVAGSVFKQAQQGNGGDLAYGRKNFHQYLYRNIDLPPGAIQVENADHVVLERNLVQHTGVDGISLPNDVTDSKLIGNRTNDIAGSAVNVGHPQHVYIGDQTSTNKEKYAPSAEGAPKNIEISNNHLYDSAVLFNGSSPISAYFTDTLSVRHNLIEKAPWNGITLGWGWWNFDGSANSVVPNVPTTTARNNNISYNQIVDTMQRLNDSAPIYTLGAQPTTTISDNYLQGVPGGHKYGLHPDEGSAFINYRDNVLNVSPDLAWTINSGNWGRQHDLNITNTYGTNNKIFEKNVPNSTIEDVRAYPDNIWPAPAHQITVNSGLEPAYRDILPGAGASAPDRVLPASTFTDVPGSSIPVRSIGDATTTIWLAPPGTTGFAAGATMTSASGTANAIAVPEASGDYKLYVVDAQGARSAESASLVRQAWTHADDKDTRVTYGGAWSNWNDTQDFRGSESFTAQAGNSAEYTFTGTGVQYVGMTQPNMGKVDVYVDGTLVQSDVDAYAPSVTKRAVLYRKTDLPAGAHTVKVVCKGTKNAASTGTVCALDAFSSVAFPATGGFYKIVNRSSGLALDVTGGSTSDGASIIQWVYGNADNQNWKFESVSGGAFEISSRRSGKLMGVQSASTADNATVVQWTDTNAADQRWQLVDAGNGYSKLKNVNSGKVLGVSGSSTAAGAQIVQVTETDAGSQQWQVVRVN